MNNHPHIIAITGGIGSGKSVVSHMVGAMGYPVYDCDSRAKRIMDESDSIKAAIADSISATCIKNGDIDRSALSSIVFNDVEKLSRLNSIVHAAVREHFVLWAETNAQTGHNICFIETAILYQSGLDALANEVWAIDAPVKLRITRVMQRNGLSREAVLARISAQDSFIPSIPHPKTLTITNDGNIPVLPRIERLIADISTNNNPITTI